MGTTFFMDGQVVTQGDVTFIGKMVESLVVKFDQAKYEEFLSSGSKSPRVARQYRRVSSEIRSQISSETSSNMICTNRAISGLVTCVAPVNVSHETREANVIEGQSCHVPPLNIPQLQVTRSYQQPVKRNRDVECRQRHHVRRYR